MILDTIAQATRTRVLTQKNVVTHAAMRIKAQSLPKGGFAFERALRKGYEANSPAFICEVKKASPSKGVIAEEFPYLDIAREYEQAGAAVISVLTEPEFFKGDNRYLSEIRAAVKIPLLRKDFTIDEYQIYEAKILGADAVLLICALLDTDTLRRFLTVCDNLWLCALVEAHTTKEVRSALGAGARIIGVNNRDLKTFKVNLEASLRLRPFIPKDVLFVSESGISTARDVAFLRKIGVHAVLVGETLMRAPDKRAALAAL
ncbi:MAG: indole-3-glycerol phosphate synthase TrpC, partial [Acetanaerobacterium sp.]